MSFDTEAASAASAPLSDEHMNGQMAAPMQSQEAQPQAQPDPAAQSADPATAQTPTVGEQPQDPAAQPQDPPKKGGVQKRIDELTRERYGAERRAQAAEQELMSLRQRQQQATPAEKPAPKIEDFQDVNSFLEARDAWVLERARDEFRREQEQAAQRQQQESQQHGQQVAVMQAVERFKGAEADARDRHADYDTVAATPHMQALRQYRPDVARAVIDSPHGPDVVYYLGKNPAVAQQLASLNPFAAAREIGRIEQLFMQPKPQASQAPAPPRQVSGGNASAGVNPENMTLKEYRAWRKGGGGR